MVQNTPRVSLSRFALRLAITFSAFLMGSSALVAQSGITDDPPIDGTNVYLFAVGSNGPNTGPISLLSGAGVVTDANGNGYIVASSTGTFNLTGLYLANCPASNPQVYLMAVGGIAGNANNPYTVELSAMPVNCMQLPNESLVVITEPTTIAAAYALAAFADTSDDGISTSSTSATALADAFAYANSLVSSISTNSEGDSSSNAYVNTLANIIQACRYSTERYAACIDLMYYTSITGVVAPVDIWQAALSMVTYPTPANYLQDLFYLPTGAAPYHPDLDNAPASWQLSITGAPVITSMTSTITGGIDTLLLTGTNFGTDAASITIIAGGVPATIESISNTSIAIQLPTAATSTTIQAFVNGLGSNPVALAKIATFAALSLEPPTITYGQSFNAVVTVSTNISAKPPGTVTCSIPGQTQTASLVSGVVTIPFSSVPAGFQVVTCAYNGSGLYAASASVTATETVLPPLASVTITLSTSPTTTTYGDLVLLTATITPSPASSYDPTGTIVFTIDGSSLPAVALTPSTSSTASLSIASLPVGSHTITVTYSGDAEFGAGTSAAVTQIVTGQSDACAPN